MADSSAAQLPTADEAFPDVMPQDKAQPSSGGLPTADEAFPEFPKPTMMQNAVHAFAKPLLYGTSKLAPIIGPVNNIVNAFNKTASSDINSSYGMSEATMKDMRDRGIWNDVGTQVNSTQDIAKYFIRNAAEAIQRPATVGIDILQNVGGGLIAGATSAVAQAGVELGANPEKAEKEANIAAQGLLGQFPLGVKGGLGIPHDPFIAPAAELNVPLVIAKGMATHALDTEDVYSGVAQPSPESSLMAHAASPEIAEQEQKPPSVHYLAGQIAPKAVAESIAAESRQQLLRENLNTLRDERDTNIQANAPHNDEIAALQEKLQDANARKTKIYQAQIDDLTEKNNAWIEEQKSQDTPEMQKLREGIQALDEIRRDHAAEVSAAYRQAREMLPKEEVKPIEAGKPQEEQKPFVSPWEHTEETPAAPIDHNLPAIINDIVNKAVAKGYGYEQAKASAELLARQYQYLAATYGGKKGTALDLYNKEKPEIIGQGEKIGEAKTLNQPAKGKYHIINDGRRIIRLMKTADASTLIHEGTHHFMDMMKRFEAEADAPKALKDDMAMLRRELGIKEGEAFSNKHEERFARGFERYVMEGHAPSKELAGIFQKFAEWLKGIYQTVKNIPNSEISANIRDFFDRTLGGKEAESVIAPERGLPESVEPSIASEGKKPNSVLPNAVKTEPTTIKDEPANPNAKLGESKSDVVDKAGNIRLDLLNTTDDIDNAIREVADENGGFIAQRRGKISNRQSLDFADAMGLDPEQIDFQRIGQADNAETIIAKTKLLIQAAKETSDAAKTGNVEAYLEAKERQKMIQGHVSGITAEAGRALQIFQALKKIEGYDEASALGKFLQENDKGKTLFQLEEEMKFVTKLQTAQQVSKFVQDSSKNGFGKAIQFYYINALLSGPITHARYAVGNAVMALWTPLVRTPVAAAVGAGREFITGAKDADSIRLGEAGAQLYAIGKGARDGLDAAIQSFKTGVMKTAGTESLLGGGTQSAPFPIPGIAGQIIGVPVKSVAAIHSFFYTLRYEQNIAGMAYREAAKQGLEGADFDLQVAKLTQSPTEAMVDAASADSMKELYMQPAEYTSFTAKLARVTNDNLPAKVLVPFAKVGINITKNAFLDQSLLGLFSKETRANLSGVNGSAVRDMQIAKIATGTAVMGTTLAAALEGNITGDGPTDPNQRRVWLLTHQPNSIKIGDVTISYARLGSLSMLMRFGADMAETYKYWDGEDGDKLAVSALEGLNKSVLDETFMLGIKNAMDAMYHPAEYGPRWIQGLATAWIPFSSGLGQVAREIDPFSRESHTILDAAKARIPILSQELQPRFDVFGNPIKNGSNYDQYKADPVVQKLEELHMGIGKLDRKIVGVQLTDAQYADYSQLAGYMAKQRLDALIGLNGFSDLPTGTQMEAIHKTIANARESARAVIKAENPEIIEQAAANKQKILLGAK